MRDPLKHKYKIMLVAYSESDPLMGSCAVNSAFAALHSAWGQGTADIGMVKVGRLDETLYENSVVQHQYATDLALDAANRMCAAMDRLFACMGPDQSGRVVDPTSAGRCLADMLKARRDYDVQSAKLARDKAPG